MSSFLDRCIHLGCVRHQNVLCLVLVVELALQNCWWVVRPCRHGHVWPRPALVVELALQNCWWVVRPCLLQYQGLNFISMRVGAEVVGAGRGVALLLAGTGVASVAVLRTSFRGHIGA